MPVDTMSTMGIFFGGLGLFFVGIGILWGISIWSKSFKQKEKK